MNIRLVKLSEQYKGYLEEMMEEWSNAGEKIVPSAIGKNDYHNFDYYLANLEITKEIDGKVPDTTLFCLDEDRNIFVGAVNIRHYLTKEMLVNGGHIGDGIRPSERRKGYATAMIGLALKEAKKQGIKGKDTTPFLLAKVKEITGGESLDSNIQLVFNNAKLGAKIAKEYGKL